MPINRYILDMRFLETGLGTSLGSGTGPWSGPGSGSGSGPGTAPWIPVSHILDNYS